jgi:hypothetical protein
LTNSLLDRVVFYDESGGHTVTALLLNNTFWNGHFWIEQGATSTALVKDNLFYNTTFSGAAYNSSNNYNGFITGQPRFSPYGANDVVAGSFTMQSSALGNRYLPAGSPFINAGSRTAPLAGLYHFTTLTNQTKEASTVVDIGYHYVALNAQGLPVDTDGDGFADYSEDRNGNGLFDAALGETDASVWDGSHPSTALRVFTSLK